MQPILIILSVQIVDYWIPKIQFTGVLGTKYYDLGTTCSDKVSSMQTIHCTVFDQSSPSCDMCLNCIGSMVVSTSAPQQKSPLCAK